MAATPATVRGIALEFRDSVKFPDSVIQVAIDRAARRVDADTWGNQADDAVGYLAAHLLAVSNPQASERPVRIFETPGAEDAGQLGSTAYGREYKTMLDGLALGVLVP